MCHTNCIQTLPYWFSFVVNVADVVVECDVPFAVVVVVVVAAVDVGVGVVVV